MVFPVSERAEYSVFVVGWVILKVDGVGGPCWSFGASCLWLVGASEIRVGIIQKLEVCLCLGSSDIQDRR